MGPLVLIVGAVGLWCGAAAPARAGAAGTLALAAALALGFGVSDTDVVPLIFCTTVPWATGRAVRAHRMLATELQQRTRELEAEQEGLRRLAIERERARIARELHDIVAHHVAVIVVQAAAGRMAVAESREEAAERLTRIARAGRDSLAELELLQGRRAGDVDDDARLARMVDQARDAGLTVRATPWPRCAALSRECRDTAHRVVQEALTNAIKHAPGAAVDVRLSLPGGALEIRVHDDGGRSQPTLASSGAGAGLDGLRERVAALGGELEAGPAGDGWRVTGRLPLRDLPLDGDPGSPSGLTTSPQAAG
jgi:signal transduction histidine kinase